MAQIRLVLTLLLRGDDANEVHVTTRGVLEIDREAQPSRAHSVGQQLGQPGRPGPIRLPTPRTVAAVIEQVVLLNPLGEAIGARAKAEVHSAATPLHLAFSLHLFAADGRVLITRRALSKATWPGVWTNSCCGHPGVDESFPDAIERRLHQELGVGVSDLSCVLPDFAYTATDASGIVENEICPVWAGRLLEPESPIKANAAEVMDWEWVKWADLVTAAVATPFAFSPWAVDQIRLLPASPFL